MKIPIRARLVVAAVVISVACLKSPFSVMAAELTPSPTYTLAQAAAGQTLYVKQCALCHGDNLNNGEALPLAGTGFQSKWGGKAAFELFRQMRTTMPATAPASLSDEQYLELLAYIFQKNALPVGSQPLTGDTAALKAMILPATVATAHQVKPAVLPPPTAAPNPLDTMTPVTDAMLQNPPDGEWLSWRRTLAAEGYSPLKKIRRDTVHRLKTAWAWSLRNGLNESTPLVHEGVIFVYSDGDVVQALNAANGDLLWEYDRQLPKSVVASLGMAAFRKALALYGNRLYLTTGDAHLVALNIRSGEVVWDVEVAPLGTRMTGGPTIAKGKVILGAGGAGGLIENGGGSIIALDAATGNIAWRFKTIPGPDEPGGHTWNALPMKKRSGGTVWTPGSYDPDLNLVYFGTGQTYDTALLRERVPGSPDTNDALYTDSTLAFNPDTGKLVWYFQHMPNDQWDFDWAFERQLMTLSVKGVMRRVVVTAGKPAVHDVLDAKTGQYLYSIDPGLQNVITAINPQTGAKTYDASKIPGNGQTPLVCPHVLGAKSWLPSAYNPTTKIAYVSLVESCMTLAPAPAGTGVLTSGVQIDLIPPQDSDGRFGRLQAIDIESKQTVWVERQRAPLTSGVLATAGGLVFAGSLDRRFAAYDDASGKKLWSTRLNEVLNSNPISYSVNGTQYIALVTGSGGPRVMQFMPLTPEVKLPVNRSSTLWVFELARTENPL